MGLARWANCGLPWLRSSVAIGACWGSGRGFPGASALVVLHPCKFGLFGYPCAIAFLHPFNKSVLRGFLGGLFGFIGARCIFDCLVAFAWLVGLYACKVKRLRTEKRKRPYFCGLRSYVFISCGCFGCCLSCGYCFAPVVCGFLLGCGLCCWCFFFPLDDCDKKKGRNFLRPLFVGCCHSFAICLALPLVHPLLTLRKSTQRHKLGMR